VDVIDGVACTLIDNGMPCVVMRAADLGIEGSEAPAELEANSDLRSKLEAIRLMAGPMMNLGDVASKSVPKMTMVSPARSGGAISTRTFIPHRCHDAIGVLGAVSVATACLLPSGPAAEIAMIPDGEEKLISVEHPTGEMSVIATLKDGVVTNAAVLRTARKLFDGRVFG
jgi:4-oxalomesaconate tautomerase